ncbi:MAG: cysteine-rich CWC family protein [Betaproteobacteria bacterium]|nr:cysteine-rich CWC family protein [Betaproteobacteria bacterium]
MKGGRLQSNSSNICPRCGKAFTCGMNAGQASCWCAELPPLAIPESGSGCYCPECLRQLVAAQQQDQENL